MASSGGFRVISGEVHSAAGTFAHQGADLDAQGAGTPRTSPETGDGALDQTLGRTRR